MVEGNAAPATSQSSTPVITPLIPKEDLELKDKVTTVAVETKPAPAKADTKQLQPPPTKTESNQFAADFMLGELIKAATMEFRIQSKPWSQMKQFDQEAVLARIKQKAEAAVKEAVEVIASTARLTFRAQVESVTFKDGVKASLKMAKTEDAHVLADQSGKTVLIVIEDFARFLNPGDAVKGDPDQKALFDASQAAKDPKDAATPPRRPPKKKTDKAKAKTATRKGRGR